MIAWRQGLLRPSRKGFAVLEQILGPLTEWSKTWADLEERLLRMGRRPEAER